VTEELSSLLLADFNDSVLRNGAATVGDPVISNQPEPPAQRPETSPERYGPYANALLGLLLTSTVSLPVTRPLWKVSRQQPGLGGLKLDGKTHLFGSLGDHD